MGTKTHRAILIVNIEKHNDFFLLVILTVTVIIILNKLVFGKKNMMAIISNIKAQIGHY